MNTTGNSALSKAGTGDVLTGMIAGFLSQKVSPFKAAILSVFLHGLAGDIAATQMTEIGMTSSDIITALPMAWKKIMGTP